ncbi:hypothetical protein [Pseudonocardia nigra]|nr:hypothetical protein [Pseudonocardia nigra]
MIRRRLLRLLLVPVGVLRVRVCELCGALVVAEAREQHERAHGMTRGDR